MGLQAWLMKSEPDAYSIQNLKKDRKTWWEGVRNYQARNFMTQSMKVDDRVLFYHSSTEPPGVAGLARVCHIAQPDPSQFAKKSEFFDPKATAAKPIWFCVQVEFEDIFPHFVPLDDLKKAPRLQDMLVLRKGQRLSIQPVTSAEFEIVCELGGVKA